MIGIADTIPMRQAAAKIRQVANAGSIGVPNPNSPYFLNTAWYLMQYKAAFHFIREKDSFGVARYDHPKYNYGYHLSLSFVDLEHNSMLPFDKQKAIEIIRYLFDEVYLDMILVQRPSVILHKPRVTHFYLFTDDMYKPIPTLPALGQAGSQSWITYDKFLNPNKYATHSTHII